MSEPASHILPRKAQPRVAAPNLIPVNAFSSLDILEEKTFLRMLCLERKRTERSRSRFVLMLLESTALLKDGEDAQGLEKVLNALARATRETDIKGWYRHAEVIGVIFTEIGSADGKSVASALLTRLTATLCKFLSIEEINEIRISFHVFPEPPGKNGPTAPDDALYPDSIDDGHSTGISRIAKRGMDIAGSLFGLVLLSPVLVTVGVLVKLSSKGPVLFRQQRVGQYGKNFTFLKFRSMKVGNDDSIHRKYVERFISGEPEPQQTAGAGQPVFKLTKDPRITPVGGFLRKTSLDELPQLINVLRGEMSLVGPRPPIPYEFRCYDIWHKRRLLAVKPGITGLWQVKGRSRVQFDDMVRMDLQYATSWSLWLDLEILYQTPRAVFAGSGAH